MPPVDDLKKLKPYAQAILDARAKFQMLRAELYDPIFIATELRRAQTSPM